jgi:hypothetical protein
MHLQFKPAIKLLLRDGFDRDKFVRLAMVTPRAEQLLLSNAAAVAGSSKTIALETMLTALWHLMGCNRFVEHYAPCVCRSGWRLEFVYRRLQDRPNEFSDSALENMQDRNDALGELSRKLLRRRFESSV